MAIKTEENNKRKDSMYKQNQEMSIKRLLAYQVVHLIYPTTRKAFSDGRYGGY